MRGGNVRREEAGTLLLIAGGSQATLAVPLLR